MDDRLIAAVRAADGIYSERLLTAIDAALVMRADERPRDIAAFLHLASEGDNEQAIADTLERAKKAYGHFLQHRLGEPGLGDTIERAKRAYGHCEYEFALRGFRKLAELGARGRSIPVGLHALQGFDISMDDSDIEAGVWLIRAAETGTP